MTDTQTNVRRVYQTYLYATCFVSMLLTLIAAGVVSTSLIKIIAPDLYGGGPGSESYVRKAASGSLISALLFGVISFAVFWYHWTLAKGVREELDRIDRAPLPSMAAPLPSMAASLPAMAAPLPAMTPDAPETDKPSRPRAPRKPPATS